MARLLFEITQDDTLPPIHVQLLDANGKAVAVQSGDVVTFRMRPVIVGLAAALDAPVTVVNAGEGLVEYEWQAADTAQPGVYEAEFHLAPPGGIGGMTFPNADVISVVIKPKA